MTQVSDTKTVTVNSAMPYSIENVWRALTEAPLIEEWLMKNNFEPVVGHHFDLKADWGVVDCEVLSVETHKSLSYTWEAYGLKSVVTWTLTPTDSGTNVHMAQSGFRADQEQAYQGATYGWQQFFAALEQVLARVV